MKPECLPMPSITPQSPSHGGLADWKAQWRAFRDAAVDVVAHIFDSSDDAADVAAGLHRLGAELSDDDEPWKLIVQARAEDELNYRHGDGHARRRRSIVRGRDDIWWFDDVEPPTDRVAVVDAHHELASKLVAHLFWWGDMNAIYLAASIHGEPAYVDDRG